MGCLGHAEPSGDEEEEEEEEEEPEYIAVETYVEPTEVDYASLVSDRREESSDSSESSDTSDSSDTSESSDEINCVLTKRLTVTRLP